MIRSPREAQIVIVGSGAAGSALAAHLASAGREVLILEAGPERALHDLTSSALWARRLKWGGSPVIERGDKPIGHAFNAGYGTGGSALHHYAVWPRLHPEDFTMRASYGRGLDWPLSYDDLRPFYDAVQTELGIGGDAQQEVWRPPGAPYPLPPSPVFAQGHAIRAGFEKLSRRTAPLPLAVTTAPYRGRRACLWDGWCDAGCPIGALANPLTVHLPRAKSAGARIVHDATVVRVRSDPSGHRVTGVDFVDRGGTRHRVEARLVILAAFAIENPRLLLASATPRHPQGLANANDMVGRFITSHTAGLLYGLMPDETEPHLGAFGGQLLNQDHYGKQSHDDPKAFGSYQWMIAQAVKPVDLLGISTSRADLFGAPLQAFMESAAKRFATMTAVVEDLPIADNRVQLSDQPDRYGVPLALVTHNADPASRALWHASLTDGKAVFEAAGSRETWTGPPGSMHIMGGTVMGSDPASSVTNSFGQCHEIENLYIAGPGLFPTSGGVNPTFTAEALALRSARHILHSALN